jgi:hypothetical protein
MSFITSGIAMFSSTIPSPVTGFIANSPTETTVYLVWKRSYAATLYSIESSPPTTIQTTSDTFITFTEMSPETEYTFTITPSNANGNGPPTMLTLPPFPGYASVVYNTPLSVTKTTIELEWFPLGEYTPAYATSYKVYCLDPVTFDILYVQTASLTTPYTFIGLQTNYGYYFQLSSVNARGEQLFPSSPSTTMYTTPTLTGFSAGNPTETTVDLTWDIPINNVGYYNFLCIITSNPATTEQSYSYPPPYTFTGLTPDTEYTFTITPKVGPPEVTGDPVTSDSISTLP